MPLTHLYVAAGDCRVDGVRLAQGDRARHRDPVGVQTLTGQAQLLVVALGE